MSAISASSYGLPDWLKQPPGSANSLQDFGKLPVDVSQPTFATRSVDVLANTSSFDPYRNLFLSTYQEPIDMAARAARGAKSNAMRRVDRYLPTTGEGFDRLFERMDRYVPGFDKVSQKMRTEWKNALVDNNKGRTFFAELAKKYKTVQSLYSFVDEAAEHAPEVMSNMKSAVAHAEQTGQYQRLKEAFASMGDKRRCINIEYDLLGITKPKQLIETVAEQGQKAALKELFNIKQAANTLQGQWNAASGDNAFAKTGDILKQLHRNELYKVVNPLKEGRVLEGAARGLGWGLLAFSWAKNTVNAYRAARIEGDTVGQSLWKSAKMFLGQGIKLLTCWQMFNIGFEVGAGLYAIFGAGAMAGAALSLPALACAIVGGAIVSAATHAIMSQFFPDAPKIVK